MNTIVNAKGVIAWTKVEEWDIHLLPRGSNGRLLETLPDIEEGQMVATFGRSTVAACEPEKGYGDEWWFWNGSMHMTHSRVFKVYSRYGIVRIGGRFDHSQFKKDLLAALHSGK